jgi:translation elongation factor EF-Tu-like GTPase
MKIEASNGEIIDKISILLIKLIKISDNKKIEFVSAELLELLTSCNFNNINCIPLLLDLLKVNKELWEIEDQIRIKEKNKEFDNEFIEIARKVYIYNDKRFQIKNNINTITQSSIQEIKSYEEFK